jgi:hypothetical protein
MINRNKNVMSSIAQLNEIYIKLSVNLISEQLSLHWLNRYKCL